MWSNATTCEINATINIGDCSSLNHKKYKVFFVFMLYRHVNRHPLRTDFTKFLSQWIFLSPFLTFLLSAGGRVEDVIHK